MIDGQVNPVINNSLCLNNQFIGDGMVFIDDWGGSPQTPLYLIVTHKCGKVIVGDIAKSQLRSVVGCAFGGNIPPLQNLTALF